MSEAGKRVWRNASDEVIASGELNVVSVDVRRLGFLLSCAVRYALGRQSYVVGDVCEIVRECWGDLLDADRRCIVRDVADAERCDTLGAGMDARKWRALLEFMKREV